MSEARRMMAVNRLEAALIQALAAGKQTCTLELSTQGWLAIVDEIKDRCPRNYSRLIRDDTVERLNEAVDRLQRQVTLLAAFREGPVAERRRRSR